MRHFLPFILSMLMLVMGCAPTYVFNDLGTLGGASSVAMDINDRGHIVGYSDTEDGAVHAFLHSGHGMIDLGTLGGADSHAYGINESDEIVGTSLSSDGLLHPFLWRDGIMVDLLPEPLWDCDFGTARAISDGGWIVGDICEIATLWQSSDSPESILATSEERFRPAEAHDINDDHQIAGKLLPLSETFIYESGTLSIIARFDTRCEAINNRAQVVGGKHVSGGDFHAYLFEEGDEIDLGTLGGADSVAYDINDNGLIVGASMKNSEEMVPFLYDIASHTMKELMSLGSGEAHGINAGGIIVGKAKNSLGNDRAVKWTLKRFRF